jgi:hypothetical protein|tara:strand:+ start:373 stop:531 length:159 start_codon:yes stop_codon:yes gene_type:complete
MIWFFQEYPIISGLIFSIILGTPSGLAIVWSIRESEDPPVKDKNLWDDEWDL